MKKDLYIHYEWSASNKEFVYSFSASDMTWLGESLIEKREIEFESPPEAEMRKAAYALLQKKRSQILADAMVKAQDIDQQAQELLALEDKSNQVIQPPKADDDIPF